MFAGALHVRLAGWNSIVIRRDAAGMEEFRRVVEALAFEEHHRVFARESRRP